MKLSDISIHAWLLENKIKNEKGDFIEFYNHPFLFDIYSDTSDNICVIKAAQVGMSTLEIIKNLYEAKHSNMDMIYTMPTDDDVKTFVGGSVNRIIEQNPILLEYTKDKDSIEQKSVGGSRIYFRGTWGKRKAQSTPADRLIHDEVDTSKPDVIAAYQSRLQHSKYKQTHVFSHPSFPDVTTDIFWKMSDQKHWFITCHECKKEQYMNWDTKDYSKMSVDIEGNRFRCKFCDATITDDDRRQGRWVSKYKDRKWSGYWISLLIAPYISAEYIIQKYQDPKMSAFEFSTKILGKPHSDGSSKLLLQHFNKNITDKEYAPGQDERVILGIDTGLKLDYVLGDNSGLFMHGDCTDYDVLDEYMRRWKKCIAVIDAGGDLIGSRAFAERWKGRVFLCYLTNDRNSKELMTWGTGDNHGSVRVDRDRTIQLCVDEFRDERLPVHGTESDWYEYWLDWSNLTRIEVIDDTTGAIKGRKWVRSGRDHRALATVFWRVGMSKFANQGHLVHNKTEVTTNSYRMNPDMTVDFNPDELLNQQSEDWRDNI